MRCRIIPTVVFLSVVYGATASAADTTVYTWGYSGWGQLGNGTLGSGTGIDNYITRPTAIARQAATVVAGSEACYAITAAGDLYAWGKNDVGQVGNGATTPQASPVVIGKSKFPTAKWLAISCKTIRPIAIMQSTGGPPAKLYSWGSAMPGTSDQTSPTLVPGIPASVDLTGYSIASGTSHVMLLAPDGSLYAFGSNSYGQLGVGNTNDSSTLVTIPPPPGGGVWSAVSCGLYFTVGISSSGDLYTWGQNDHRGQLGNGSFNTNLGKSTIVNPDPTSLSPKKIMSGFVWKSVACGYDHSLALTSDENLYGWGSNFCGELGIGSDDCAAVPALIGIGWSSVVCGDRMSFGFQGAQAFAWGANALGQLGTGSKTDSKSPVSIIFPGTAISAGSAFAVGR